MIIVTLSWLLCHCTRVQQHCVALPLLLLLLATSTNSSRGGGSRNTLIRNVGGATTTRLSLPLAAPAGPAAHLLPNAPLALTGTVLVGLVVAATAAAARTRRLN